MKSHFCPKELTVLSYENECNWCGEKEMTQDEIIRMAREAGWKYADGDDGYEPLWHFAALVAAHEREKWEPAFNKHKPAPKIDNGNVYFEAGLYTPLEVQLAIDLLKEREAVLEIVHTVGGPFAEQCAAAIQARGK